MEFLQRLHHFIPWNTSICNELSIRFIGNFVQEFWQNFLGVVFIRFSLDTVYFLKDLYIILKRGGPIEFHKLFLERFQEHLHQSFRSFSTAVTKAHPIIRLDKDLRVEKQHYQLKGIVKWNWNKSSKLTIVNRKATNSFSCDSTCKR